MCRHFLHLTTSGIFRIQIRNILYAHLLSMQVKQTKFPTKIFVKYLLFWACVLVVLSSYLYSFVCVCRCFTPEPTGRFPCRLSTAVTAATPGRPPAAIDHKLAAFLQLKTAVDAGRLQRPMTLAAYPLLTQKGPPHSGRRSHSWWPM